MFALFRIKYFGLVLSIVILLQAAHASYYNYGYLFLQEIDAPAYAIGIIINTYPLFLRGLFPAVLKEQLAHA
jgi:PPP family 3-phenylpropionic acid transporter